jgi:hypothetical protein
MFSFRIRPARGGMTVLAFACIATLPAVTRAQQQQAKADAPVFDAKGAEHIRNEYLADLDTVHVKIVALATAIPADKFSWRPAAGVRSVSEAFMHVASEW